MSRSALTLSPELPWVAVPEDERRFRRLVLVIAGIFLLLSLAMPFLPLPERPERETVELPPRVAELILQRQQKPPPPPEVARKIEPEKKKPEPKKPEPEVKKPEQKPEPKKQTTEQARKKAATSGILAFSDQLADLRDLSSVSSLSKKSNKLTVASEQSKSAQQATAPTRSVITSGASEGSGGINTSTLSTSTGGTQLAARTTSRVEAPVTTQGAATAGSQKTRTIARTAEEITDVIDRNKGALFRIYNRELRSDPTLKGKVVLEITIAPSGKVTAVKVLSSELSAPKLERKLLARIKLINFGAKEVGTITTTLPIDFFPA